MATTTMHFGPEWMRAKPQSCTPRQQLPPSPPPAPPPALPAPATPSSYSYSALVAPLTHVPDKHDDSRPFRYTKHEMLKIYKDGGGRGRLNLEVERWEGIVRDVASEPAALREMTDAEKKLFAGPLNSELRRRQSSDFINTLSPSDRQRLVHPNSAANNAMRYTPFSARRRDSTDQPPLVLPRKLSLSNTQGVTSSSPRDALPSPRNRIGTFASGFDGVLNGGDAWSRRRPSVGASGTTGVVMARESKEDDSRRSDIKEEEEAASSHSSNVQDNNFTATTDLSTSPGRNVFSSDPMPDAQVSSPAFDPLGQSMAGPSSEVQNQPRSTPQAPLTINSVPSAPSGPPPGLVDPASVEWSYLDPQGQVQGPFRADVMQKWFNEGYFAPDLLIKRTHVDADWTAVGILERRAIGGKIFLPPISNTPPGLAVRTESPKNYSPVHEQSIFNGYHTIPIQTLRTTLDASLSGVSPVESPSSSLGGGRFGDGSSDPSTLVGGAGNSVYSSDSTLMGHTFTGRAAFQDSISDARTFGNNVLGRAPSIDTLNAYSRGGDTSPWPAGPGQGIQGLNENEQHPYSNGFSGLGSGAIGSSLPVNHVHSIDQERFGDTTYSGLNHYDSPVTRQPPDVNGVLFNSNMANGLSSHLSARMQFSHPPSTPHATPQHRQSASPLGDLLSQTTEGPSVTQTPISAVQPNNASPWTTTTRSFESPAAPSPVVAPEWIASQPPQQIDPSPWLIASLPVADDVWREMPGANSLTFSNLGQHDKLQQLEEERAGDIAVPPIENPAVPPPNVQSTQVEPTNVMSGGTTIDSQSIPLETIPASASDTQGSIPPKSKRKSTTREIQAPVTKVVPPPTSTVVKDQPSPTVSLAGQPKPVWAVEDESKRLKVAGATMTLREIQEAEVRKAEARKAAEKERERVARVNTTSGNVVEESQPFTSSWGLPTSQAGARNQTSSRETTVNSTPTTPAAPAWVNTASTAKKTMKEIQEEEERRKKLAVKESMVSVAARRAYAETTLKVVPNAQATGGAWTTVGPNGKPTPPATSIPRPPANSPNNLTPPTAPRPNGVPSRPAVAATVKVATPRVEDFSTTPSHDFLKWLGESLKGLNSSVNLEEIASMLLSFPLDPDQSTLEIISDLIYANSTTLDGRRFASEYVTKRKADAATRRGIMGASGQSSKPTSIADVVKAQPKPVQQEWGFKVVNKKKRGGRP